MPSLRPLASHLPKRPSIHEIASSILTPTASCRAHYSHSHCLALPYTLPNATLLHHPQRQRLHTSPSLLRPPPPTSAGPPQTHDRGPASTETTQTDFSTLDVLGNTPVPSTSIDACLWDGFHLNNGVKITGGVGVLLVAGEAFGWRPWEVGMLEGRDGERSRRRRLLNEKGQWEVSDGAWGVLELVWPKPDLLILGLGPSMAPLSPATRKYINGLGIRVDVQDTRNASAQFNLLATERGVGSVAAALIPLGWREGLGVK